MYIQNIYITLIGRYIYIKKFLKKCRQSIKLKKKLILVPQLQ